MWVWIYLPLYVDQRLWIRELVTIAQFWPSFLIYDPIEKQEETYIKKTEEIAATFAFQWKEFAKQSQCCLCIWKPFFFSYKKIFSLQNWLNYFSRKKKTLTCIILLKLPQNQSFYQKDIFSPHTKKMIELFCVEKRSRNARFFFLKTTESGGLEDLLYFAAI